MTYDKDYEEVCCQMFLEWLAYASPETLERYPLTRIKLPSKMYWMSPTIQKMWEDYTGKTYDETGE